MACCEGTVMSRMHRGRQRLRKCCEPQPDGYEYEYDGDYAVPTSMPVDLMAVSLAVVIVILEAAGGRDLRLLPRGRSCCGQSCFWHRGRSDYSLRRGSFPEFRCP